MLSIIKSNVGRIGKAVLKQKLKKEYEAQTHVPNERPVEYRFVFQSLQKLAPKTVLDVGTGLTALPHLMSTCGLVVTALDYIKGYYSQAGMFNRHFHLVHDDITATQMKGQWDLVTCISTLEHIKNHQAAVKSMFSLLRPKGHLVMTFPFNENQYIPNSYDLPGSVHGKNVNYICQMYSRRELNGWLEGSGGKIIEQEYWQCFNGDFWSLGGRVNPSVMVSIKDKHHLTCVLIQKS